MDILQTEIVQNQQITKAALYTCVHKIPFVVLHICNQQYQIIWMKISDNIAVRFVILFIDK